MRCAAVTIDCHECDDGESLLLLLLPLLLLLLPSTSSLSTIAVLLLCAWRSRPSRMSGGGCMRG